MWCTAVPPHVGGELRHSTKMFVGASTQLVAERTWWVRGFRGGHLVSVKVFHAGTCSLVAALWAR